MFVCVAGKNNIGVDVLEYLIKNCNGRYELGVVCNRNESGKNTWQKSMRFFAEKNGIKEYKLEETYNIKNLIFISLEFDQIVKPELFLDAKLFNIHFSLLPAYKGMYTSAIPILNGEKYVGVTFHRIDRGIDTGDIIKQKKFEISDTITCRELYLQYIKYGTRLVLDCIEAVLAGKEYAEAQKAQGSTYYSKKYIDYSNIVIDLKQTAENISRQIRAYSFREYQMPKVYDRKIIATRITNVKSTQKPGTILMENEQSMLLATIDYNIILYFDRFDELIEACKNGECERVKEICVVPEHINAANESGWTPLIVATYYNQINIVKFLLMNGADIHARNNNGTNLLMYAKEAYIKYESKELFHTFLKLGLDIEECDYAGKSLQDYLHIVGRDIKELLV